MHTLTSEERELVSVIGRSVEVNHTAIIDTHEDYAVSYGLVHVHVLGTFESISDIQLAFGRRLTRQPCLIEHDVVIQRVDTPTKVLLGRMYCRRFKLNPDFVHGTVSSLERFMGFDFEVGRVFAELDN